MRERWGKWTGGTDEMGHPLLENAGPTAHKKYIFCRIG